jgi:hypothetical protein
VLGPLLVHRYKSLTYLRDRCNKAAMSSHFSDNEQVLYDSYYIIIGNSECTCSRTRTTSERRRRGTKNEMT